MVKYWNVGSLPFSSVYERHLPGTSNAITNQFTDEIIRLASGNTFRSMCKWKFRKYGSIKLSFGSYKCRRTHGTCPCSYKDPFLSFFFPYFLFAMERSTLNSEVPSLQTYRFVPGTTAEKHEHSEFANCCQTDPAAIWTSQIHFREKHFSTMERETEEIRVCV